jgi:hypothetical protein
MMVEITEISMDTDEKVREDWRKITSSEDIGSFNFVGCGNGVFTTSIMSMDELCSAVE